MIEFLRQLWASIFSPKVYANSTTVKAGRADIAPKLHKVEDRL